MWYVVQVETGREHRACADICRAAADVVQECFTPLFRTGRRQPDGSWRPCDERLLPGYVLCSTEQAEELAASLRRMKGWARVLGNENAFTPLSSAEAAWIERFTQKGARTVGESVGYMDAGKLVIAEGPLAGRENWVVKVNHRKRLAYLEMPMGGRKVKAQAGLHVLSKSQAQVRLRRGKQAGAGLATPASSASYVEPAKAEAGVSEAVR